MKIKSSGSQGAPGVIGGTGSGHPLTPSIPLLYADPSEDVYTDGSGDGYSPGRTGTIAIDPTITLRNLWITALREPYATPSALASVNMTGAANGIIAVVTSLSKLFQFQSGSTETPDNVSVIGATGGGNWVQVKGRYLTAANDTALLALTTSDGDIAYVTADNTTYIKNNGTAGTMADWSILNEDFSFAPNVNIQSASYQAQEIDINGLIAFQGLSAVANFTLPTAAQVALEIGQYFDVKNDSNHYVIPTFQGSDLGHSYNLLAPETSVRIQKIAQSGANTTWDIISPSSPIPFQNNLIGTQNVNIVPAHNGTTLYVAYSDVGTINFPLQSSQYLPVGFSVRVFNIGLTPYSTVVSGSDLMGNNQVLLPNNSCTFTKLSIDDSGNSTWVMGALDASLTSPRSTYLVSVDFTVDTPSYNNSIVFMVSPITVTLDDPNPSINNIVPGMTTTYTNISSGNCTITAATAGHLNNATSIIVPPYSSIEISALTTSSTPQWYVTGGYPLNSLTTVVYKNSSFNITDASYDGVTVILTNGIGVTLSNPTVAGLTTVFKNISGDMCELNGFIDGFSTIDMANYTAYTLQSIIPSGFGGAQWSIINSYLIPTAPSIITSVTRTNGIYYLSSADAGTLIVCDDTAPLEIAIGGIGSFEPPFAFIAQSGGVYATTLACQEAGEYIAGQSGNLTIPLGSGVIVSADGVQLNITGSSITWLPSTNISNPYTTYTLSSVDQGTQIVATSKGIAIELPEQGQGFIPWGFSCDFYNADTNTPMAFTAISGTLIEGYETVYLQPGYRATLFLDAATEQYIFKNITNFLTGGVISFVNLQSSNYSPGTNQMGQAYVASYFGGFNTILASLPGAYQVENFSAMYIGSSGSQQSQIAPQGSDTIGGYRMQVPIPPNSGVILYQPGGSTTDWELIGNPQNNRNTLVYTSSSALTLTLDHWGAIIEITSPGVVVTIPQFQASYADNNTMVQYFWCTIKNGASGNITVQTTSPDKLDNATSIVIPPLGSLEFHGRPDPGSNNNNFFSLNGGNGGGVSTIKSYQWAAPPVNSFSDALGSSFPLQGSALTDSTNIDFPFQIPQDFGSLINVLMVYYTSVAPATTLYMNSICRNYDGSGAVGNDSATLIASTSTFNFNTLDISSLFSFIGPKSWGTLDIYQNSDATSSTLVVGFILNYNTIPS